jgi:hypothetical protein
VCSNPDILRGGADGADDDDDDDDGADDECDDDDSATDTFGLLDGFSLFVGPTLSSVNRTPRFPSCGTGLLILELPPPREHIGNGS